MNSQSNGTSNNIDLAGGGSVSSTSNNSNSNNSNNNSSSASITNNKCNLIINYLPQSLKEHDFNQLFSKIGPIKTCKLMFDRQTGYSFGYGFVEYVNEEDARKAIDAFNGYQIEHKRLKVALARPNCDETKNTNLYIRNIPITYDEQQLLDLFSQYGEVVQTRILRDQNTTFSRRIGFVIMATKQMAQVAIQNLDNTIPPNGASEPIFVKYADEEGKKRGSGGGGGGSHNHRNNNHHRGNHHHNQHQHHHHQNNQAHNFNFNHSNNSNNNSMLIQQQNQLLQNLGKMKTNRSAGPQNRYNPLSGNQQLNNPNGAANMMNNGANFGNSSPWNNMIQQQQSPYSANAFGNSNANATGFENLINTIGTGAASNQYQQQANYLNPAAAAAAMAAMAGLGGSNNNNLLDASNPLDSLVNKQLNSGGSSSNSNIIYVYGVGSSATESDLYALFSHCGRILRVNVIKNPKTGQCKGYGFVVFETYEEAYFAVHNMNGYMYHNRPLQVSLKSFKSINNSNISNISSSNNSNNNNNNNYNNNSRLNNSNSHQHPKGRDKKRH